MLHAGIRKTGRPSESVLYIERNLTVECAYINTCRRQQAPRQAQRIRVVQRLNSDLVAFSSYVRWLLQYASFSRVDP